jgi:hypothetical protein
MEIGVSLESYLRLLRKAPELDSFRDYALNAGEMNPVIFENFVAEIVRRNLPLAIWEPFAGTSFTGSAVVSVSQNYAAKNGIKLISFGLGPTDPRIAEVDSTERGPGTTIGGILFHPPYYGSAPMSPDTRDLSLVKDKAEYLRRLGTVVDNAIPSMVPDSLACAVGRSYRTDGQVMRLELMFLQLFESRGFTLVDVWKSEPDVVLILCNRI